MLKHKPVYYTHHPNPNISFTLTFYLSSILKSVIIPLFILKFTHSHNLTSQNSQNIKTVFSVIKTKEIKLKETKHRLQYLHLNSCSFVFCFFCCFLSFIFFFLSVTCFFFTKREVLRSGGFVENVVSTGCVGFY